MTMTQEHLVMAIRLATDSFNGQVAKDGSPSLLHSLSVLLRVSRAFPEKCRQYYLLCVVAVLHDYLEDCASATKFNLELYFGLEVADLVDLLTRKKGVKYADYSQKVLDSKSIATIVKYFDMQDNLERCKWLTGDEAVYLRGKYVDGIIHFEKDDVVGELISKVHRDCPLKE